MQAACYQINEKQAACMCLAQTCVMLKETTDVFLNISQYSHKP